MTPSTTHPESVWRPLRQAIIQSSGFQIWLQDRPLPDSELELDQLAREYLEQTLSTLAY